MNETKKSRSSYRARRATALALVSLLVGPPAMAQEAKPVQAPDPKPAGSADAKPEQTITVTGTRMSIASANDRKKNAGTVVDSIVAEDINQFPDKNIGEALSRITGVQLSRDFGEGTQVSIRGVEPDLNRVEINGMSVLGSAGTAGRGADFREMASELIKSIDVYKGSTADLTEGGIGGTVAITTRKPLDFDKRTISATVSGEHSTSRGGTQPRGGLLIADKFLDNRLGLMVNFTSDDVHLRNDYSRNTSWTFLRDWDFTPGKTITSLDPIAAAVTTPAGCASIVTASQANCNRQWFDYAPQIARYGIWERDTKRTTGEFTAQFKVDKDWTVFGSYQPNTTKQHIIETNFGTDFSAVTRLANAGNAPVYNTTTGVQTTAGTCIAAPTTSTPAGMIVTDHRVTQYTVGSCLYVAGQGGNGAFGPGARDFLITTDSKYLSTGFNFKGRDLVVDGTIDSTRSNYGSEFVNLSLSQNAPGLVVNLDAQGLPHFTFPKGYNPEDLSSYTQATMQYRPTETVNKEDQLKLDFKYRLNMPVLSKIWFGVQSRKASTLQWGGGGYTASNGKDLVSTADDVVVQTGNVNTSVINDFLFNGTAQRAPDVQPFSTSTQNYNTYVSAAKLATLLQSFMGRSDGTFFNGYGDVANVPASWPSPNIPAAMASGAFNTSNFNHNFLQSALATDGQVYPQIPAFDVSETIKSAYVRLDFDQVVYGLDLTGNFGVRYTRTNDMASGINTLRMRMENSPGSTAFTDRNVAVGIKSFNNTYHDVLPSFNAAAWIMPDKLVARFGLSKVMARPSISLLVPNSTCTIGSGLTQFGGTGTDACTAGNPDLKPYRATNTDLSVEYYPNRDTTLSVAVFKKNITSSILSNVLQPKLDFFHDGNLFDVTQTINGPGAVTNGIELRAATAFTFLPGFLSGFGSDVNFTRMGYRYAGGTALINPLDGSELAFPGMSRKSYNVPFWYDYDAFNARLAYNYRDAYYTGAVDVSKNPNFAAKTGYLDGKIQYRFSPNITFSFEGKNLTNQAETRYSVVPERSNEVAVAGKRYYVSVSIKN